MSESSPPGFGGTGSCPPGCGVSESSRCVPDGSESSPPGLDMSESSPHECGGGNSIARGLVVRRARGWSAPIELWRLGEPSRGVAYPRAPTGALRVGEPPYPPPPHTHTHPTPWVWRAPGGGVGTTHCTMMVWCAGEPTPNHIPSGGGSDRRHGVGGAESYHWDGGESGLLPDVACRIAPHTVWRFGYTPHQHTTTHHIRPTG